MMKAISIILFTSILAYPQDKILGKTTVKGSSILGSTQIGSMALTVVSLPGNPSNTQAIISYTAPTTGVCHVVASESPSLSPVVHDVDTSLFTNSDLDSRDGDLGAGTTSRIIIIGQRVTNTANDAANYSRSLQTNTTHYIRVNCASGVFGTANFTTANIPGGLTFPEIPNVVTPGVPFLPTVSTTDRTQSIIDQYTGAKMKAVTIFSDRNGTSPILGFDMSEGGFVRIFSPAQQTTSDGKVGFVASVHNTGNSASNIYFIETSTGFVRALGWANPSDNPVKLDSNLCYESNRNSSTAVRYCYNGAWVEQPNTNAFDVGTTVSTVSMATQLLAFDATYDSSLFPSSVAPFADAFSYNLFTVNRTPSGNQDSYGWNVVYYGGDGRLYNPACTPVVAGGNCPGIIAAFLSMNNSRTKYCGNHNTQLMPNVPTNPTIPMQILSWHGLQDNSSISTGEWGSTITVQLNPAGTSATISAVPTNRSGTDAFNPGNWAIGDIIGFHIPGPIDDAVTVTGVSGSGPYTVTFTPAIAGGHTYPIGTQVTELCNAKNLSGNAQNWEITYWKFLSDPHGTDTTNTTLVLDQYFEDGHYDNGTNGRIVESPSGWDVVPGNITSFLNQPIPLEMTDSPTFHGIGGQCFSGSCTKHPSCHVTTLGNTTEQLICDDLTPVSGGGQFYGGNNNPVGSPVTGSLYIYPGAIDPPYSAAYGSTATLRRKVVPTFAYTGSTPYKDVSGPSSIIGGGAGDNWKYCVVLKAGECIGGSTVGQIYFNTGVTLDFPYCTDSDSPQPTRKNICIGMMPTYGQTIPQLYTSASSPTNAIRGNRVLSHGLVGLGQAGFNFPESKQTPDGSWSFFYSGKGNPACDETTANFCNIWAIKNPPFPTSNPVDGSDYNVTNISVTVPSAMGITNVIVRFGYLEFGTTSQLYCTSRLEGCVANQASIPAAPDPNPFYYPTEGVGGLENGLAGVACTTTCMIPLPTPSGRVVYYSVVYRSGSGTSNSVVQVDPVVMTMVQ